MKIKQTTLRAPDVLLYSIKKKAKKQGLTRNALILQILGEWEKKNINQ